MGMKSGYKKSLSILLALVMATSFVLPVYAQTFDESKCNVRENEAECRKRLQEIAGEIQIIDTATGKVVEEQKEITGEINKLTGEIKKTTNEIKKKNSLIQNIKGDIVEKEGTLEELNARLAREKESLKKILRKRYELGDASVFEYMLSAKTVSEFYEDAPALSYIQDSLSDSFEIIDGLKVEIYGQKSELEKRREQEDAAKYGLQIEQEKIEAQKKDRNIALSVSEQKEASLAELKKAREAEANRIKAQLFKLAGGIQGGGIPFGDALEYANEASLKTGVRPALILAILQQESNMGKNVGTCNRPGDTRTWKDIMPGPLSGSWRDDQTAYLKIMSELGLPPEGQPLSCPVSTGGWGGAMGPTQFIPTTWLGIRNSLATILGVSATNPWNPRHAVFATAIYMRDLGASSGGYTNERNAACKYYSGKACGQSSLPNTFYGDQVMGNAIQIQTNIDTIERDS